MNVHPVKQDEFISYKPTSKERAFLDTLQYKAFLYFIDEANRYNGLVKDRSTKESPSSIAAVGFGLPVLAVGAEHKWISREEAAERTLNALNFFLHCEQSTDSLASGYKGFFYHFLDMKTGRRYWNCELSSIDTGLLLAGIIFSRQYFNGNAQVEKEIRKNAAIILKRVDWNFFVLHSTSKDAGSISMAWYPGTGLANIGWRGYNEALILYIIAAGSGMNNPERAYNAWLSTYEWQEPYEGLGHVVFPPLFGHQYSEIFVDFRGIADKYMEKKGIDYFENSRRATLTQHLYAIENPYGWKGYDSLTWGITACDGPDNSKEYNGKKILGYAGRGTSGIHLNYFDDGTLAPTAAGGSIVFTPELSIRTLMNMYNKYYDEGIWGKYGLVDAFNPTVNWFDDQYLGIDQGPIVLMIENFRNGFVWKYVMNDPIIKKGLKRLRFNPVN